MPPTLNIFPDNPAVARAFASELTRLIQSLSETQSSVSISLSGGSTPKLLFSVLASEYANSIDWNKVHFFWCDERCVVPSNPESNYGEAERLLFSNIHIPKSNIHRIVGESDPALERARYEQEVLETMNSDPNELPKFDIVLLGMGSDGHTASIFPHQIEFMQSDRVCEIATHPESGQKRITLTGPVLNLAANVFFLVTGENKARVLAEIIGNTGQCKTYPTYYVSPTNGSQFYIDQSAGSLI